LFNFSLSNVKVELAVISFENETLVYLAIVSKGMPSANMFLAISMTFNWTPFILYNDKLR